MGRGAHEAALPGYVCVVSKRHVVEPFEMTARERGRFWGDVVAAGEAMADLFHAVKINYELHGNTIPHLHVHVYPRFVGDPFEGRPIDARRLRFDREARDLALIRRALAHRSPSRPRGTRKR